MSICQNTPFENPVYAIECKPVKIYSILRDFSFFTLSIMIHKTKHIEHF